MLDVVEERKECPKCGVQKSLVEFYTYKNGKTYSICKKCHNARTAEHHKKNPGLRAKSNWARRGIKITEEQYQERLVEQDSKCAICQRTCGSGRRLSVDHDHASGNVRGLLCLSCNQAVGKIENGTLPLDRLLGYLAPERT